MVLGVIAVVVAMVIALVVGLAVRDDDTTAGSGSPGGRSERAGAGVADLAGDARSAVISGTVRDLTSVHLRDLSGFSVRGTVTDAAGRPLGSGRIESTGTELLATAAGLDLGVSFARVSASGPARISPDLMPDSRWDGTASIRARRGGLELSGSVLTFTPDPREGEAATRARTIAGPASVTGGAVEYEGDSVSWVDVPSGPMTVASGWLSWAGAGAIVHSGATYESEFLGVRGDGLITLERTDGVVKIRGEADVAQVWSDGEPQIRTVAEVEIKATPAPVAPGAFTSFTWAPTNRGAYDMAMTRIGPGNDAGGWVELALDRLPAMDGGEGRPGRGGDTAGLVYDEGGLFDNATQPISSMIRPGTGDERNIGVHVPRDARPGRYLVVLVVEGNFDTLRVEVPITVR